QHRTVDYESAAQSYAQSDTAQAHYNRGNALAKAGKLDEAIKAYDEALRRQPDFEDAEANRALVEALKQQQEQQQQQDQQNQGDDNQEQQDDENSMHQQQNSTVQI